MANTSDHGVAETAFDAIHCKISAVNQGYFQDPYASLFEKKAARRIPLIHRGYYLRHIAVERAVSLFLEAASNNHRPAQIVSLGAGFDTLFFRIAASPRHPPVHMFEVDCDAISSQKVAFLQANPAAFFGPNGKVTASDTTSLSATLHNDQHDTASTYAAISCDLGNTALLQSQLEARGLDPSLPTLVLAECVLAYLAPAASTALLKWTCGAFADCMLVSYDPIGLADTFGDRLQRYFEAKGCALRSASIMTSVQAYTRFLRQVGWRCIRLDTMSSIYDALTDAAERARVDALEPFDELEDWILTNHHYGVVVATNQSVVRPGQTDGQQASRATVEAVLAWPATAASMVGTTTSHAMSPTTVVTVRPFQTGDERDVRRIFEAGHLPTSSKSVRKLVAKALQSDMANISQAYLSPGTLAGFWVATVPSSEGKAKVVGCVALKPHRGDDVAELCRLGVDADVRRLGIASMLVDELERHAFAACGYRSIVLDTLGTMEAAKAFYTARGYRHTTSTTIGNEGLVLDSFEKQHCGGQV